MSVLLNTNEKKNLFSLEKRIKMCQYTHKCGFFLESYLIWKVGEREGKNQINCCLLSFNKIISFSG